MSSEKSDYRSKEFEASFNERVRQNALSRRRFMQMIGVGGSSIALASFLAACGGDDDDDATATSDGGGEATAAETAMEGDATAAETAAEGDATEAATAESGSGEGTSGGTLRYGTSGEPDSLDMHRTPSSTAWEVGWSLYDTLIIAAEDLTLYPSLAESWETSEDGLSFTFTLREDVVFHDGTPFNAEAVKFNLDRVADPETGALYAFDDLGPYVGTEVVDDYTVTVTMSEPYGFFIRAMSLMEFAMISPSVADMVLEDVGRNPIGSGPFKFQEWVTQESITVVRNDDYQWGPSPPYDHSGPSFLDQIDYVILTDTPTRVAALEAGEVNAINRTPGTDVDRLEADGFKIIKGLQTGMGTGFYVNVNKFPTDDPAVRRAINLGLDREQISAGLYAGQEAPGYCPLTPTTFAYWDCTDEVYFDPEEAQQILEEAGWEKNGDFYEKDGETLTLDVFVFGTAGPTGEAFQAAIRPIGIDVNLQVLPFSEQHAVGFEGQHNLMLGRFDAPDPRILAFMFHSDNSGENGFTWTHLMEADPDTQAQLDEMLDEGDAETDPEARIAIYEEIQQMLVDLNMFVPIKYDAMIIAMEQKVEGWMMNDLGYQARLYDVYFSE